MDTDSNTLIDPKDVIAKWTVEELNETADNYFRQMTNLFAVMAKPFTSPQDASYLLQNFGQLLSGMKLARSMTVLEFGAGTCWMSRFLLQMGCKPISCDVSAAALEIGKRLFAEYPIIGPAEGEPVFLHFDGHRINLPDESVDRIICSDAFHHVPNQEEVMKELARVLKRGGVAGFCEPGRYHSRTALSQYEMKNFRVLENDINIIELFEIAKRSGFFDIKLKLLGDMELSISDYEDLTSESWDNKKLTRRVQNNIRDVMTNGHIFFLFKGKYMPDSRVAEGLAHEIRGESTSFTVSLGDQLRVPLHVTNTGVARWLTGTTAAGSVQVGAHQYDLNGNLVNIDAVRHPLDIEVDPGESFSPTIALFPQTAGEFVYYIDMVSEQVCWFENLGSKPFEIRVVVS
jgi:ubiquinone/menaquinone biosynthesis C-methylase UbiE